MLGRLLGTLFSAMLVAVALWGNPETGAATLIAVLDNLGKGASGAAVQNLNLMLGLDEAAGL